MANKYAKGQIVNFRVGNVPAVGRIKRVQFQVDDEDPDVSGWYYLVQLMNEYWLYVLHGTRQDPDNHIWINEHEVKLQITSV